MKFTVTAESLRNAINSARPAVSPNATLPARTAVNIEAVKGKNPVRVTGSGEEATIVAGVPNARVTEPGSVLAPPTPLFRWLNTLSPEVILTVEKTDGGVRLSQEGAAPYAFRTLKDTFPADPVPKTNTASVDLSRLHDALARLRKIASQDPSMLHVAANGADLIIDAADQFRLARVTLPGAAFGEFSANIRLSSAERIARVEPVTLNWDTRAIRALGDTVAVTERFLADQQFPAVETVLSRPTDQELTVDADVFLRSLHRLASVDPDAAVTLTFDADTIIAGLQEASVGAGQESIPSEAQPSTDFTTSVNLKFLTDAVAAHPGCDITLKFTSPKEPLFFCSVTGTVDTTSVIMPLNL